MRSPAAYGVPFFEYAATVAGKFLSRETALASDDDRVLGFVASSGDRDLLTVETSRGAEQTISTAKYSLTGRGGRGRELLQRGEFTRILPGLPALPSLGT